MEPIELEMDSVIELAVGLDEQEWEQFEELIISEAENLPTDDNGDVDAEAVGEQVVNRLCTDPALEPFLRRLVTGLVDEALWEIADRQSEHEHEDEDGGGQDS